MKLLLAYFPRQLRDIVLTRGTAMLIIAVMMSLPLLLGAFPIGEGADVGVQLGNTLQGMAVFLTMVATYSIIGEDVRRGYFRFLFSKPINPVLYYTQAFLAAAITFLAVQLVMVGVFSVVVQPAWPGRLFFEMIALFVLLGSVIFALSRVVRLDWLIGMLLFFMGEGVRDWAPAAESIKGKIFNVLLPPSHLLDDPLFAATGIDWWHVAWVGGYAAIMFAVGLSQVRFIPLGTQR